MTDRPKLDAVMDAISAVEVTGTAAWRELGRLSSRTHVEDIETVPGGIFEAGTDFTAAATIYVDLHHGEDKEPASVIDSFPAQVQGHFDSDGRAIVDLISVDTSSFYD